MIHRQIVHLRAIAVLLVLLGYAAVAFSAVRPPVWTLAEGPFPYPGPPPGTQCLWVNPAPGCNCIIYASPDCRNWKIMRVDLYRDGGIYGHALTANTWGNKIVIGFRNEPTNSTLKTIAYAIPGVNSFTMASGGFNASSNATVSIIYPPTWPAKDILAAYQNDSAADFIGTLPTVKAILRPSGVGAKTAKLAMRVKQPVQIAPGPQ